jgi:hypothetical protein
MGWMSEKSGSIHSERTTLISVLPGPALEPTQPPMQEVPEGLPLKGKAAEA